ncbi:MAG: hypothetical protein Q8O38_07110, partial [Sulfurimicrobium sp.]|nr:hypothetical protein [Sulfurimicrobium sp.]
MLAAWGTKTAGLLSHAVFSGGNRITPQRIIVIQQFKCLFLDIDSDFAQFQDRGEITFASLAVSCVKNSFSRLGVRISDRL